MLHLKSSNLPLFRRIMDQLGQSEMHNLDKQVFFTNYTRELFLAILYNGDLGGGIWSELKTLEWDILNPDL